MWKAGPNSRAVKVFLAPHSKSVPLELEKLQATVTDILATRRLKPFSHEGAGQRVQVISNVHATSELA